MLTGGGSSSPRSVPEMEKNCATFSAMRGLSKTLRIVPPPPLQRYVLAMVASLRQAYDH